MNVLPKVKSAKILDIGSGAGHFLKFIDEYGYENYIGVDVSREQIDFCRKNVTKKALLIKDLSTYLQNNKNTFDFILMNDVIEHLEKEEIIDTLLLVFDALKRNSSVLIKTENLKNRWGSAVRYMDFTHTVGFTEESIRQVLLISGFKKINIRTEIHPAHDIKSIMRLLLKFFFEFFYRLEYIASFGSFHPNLSNMLIVEAKKVRKHP